VNINWQQIGKISLKILGLSENIATSFSGATFLTRAVFSTKIAHLIQSKQ